MDEDRAEAFRRWRECYSYPAGGIETVATLELANEPFRSAKMRLAFPREVGAARTSIQFDEALCALLRSSDEHSVRRGVASVVYWGYLTFSPEYAKRRVTWLVAPRGGKGVALGVAAVVDHVRDAIECVDTGRSGDALRAIGRIAQLSRTPFASKVIAFTKPESVGIYDNRIGKALVDPPRGCNPHIVSWIRSITSTFDVARGVGFVSERRVQRRFENWCRVLEQTANELNDFGTGFRWQDEQAGAQVWRAIDVERAIFAAVACRVH